MLAGAGYNVIDSIFVGQGVGMIALTAVTIAFPIMTLLMAIGMLIGIGAGALVSISLGEKRIEEAEQVLGNALMMAIVFIIPAALIVLHFLDPLLTGVMGATPQVLPYAHDFVSIVLLASVFLHIGFGLNNVVRAQGNPNTALATQVLSFGVNLVLGYVFIFVFHWGIKGAALATAIGQGSSAVWVLGFFLSGRGVLRLRLRHMRPRLSVMGRIAAIGVAPFTMQLGMSAVMVVLNWLILGLGGDAAVAAFGVVNRVVMLVLMPVIGVSQGAQPIIGYNFGAGKPRRVVETVAKATVAATAICVVAFLAAEMFADDIIRLFSGDPRHDRDRAKRVADLRRDVAAGRRADHRRELFPGGRQGVLRRRLQPAAADHRAHPRRLSSVTAMGADRRLDRRSDGRPRVGAHHRAVRVLRSAPVSQAPFRRRRRGPARAQGPGPG